jgi:predicted nuclease of predicted toxin-antitoxin system
MKIIIDMNLSPDLVKLLQDNGFEAVHWSQIGAGNAPDREIMAWAKSNDYIVLTHDLDFGTILATSQARAPSVVQIRIQDLLSSNFLTLLVNVLRQFTLELEKGALITVEPNRAKVRILPIGR